MAHAQVSIDLLPRWRHLFNVALTNTRIAAIPGKGSGLVAIGSSSQSSGSNSADNQTSHGHDSSSPLISVPADLVLHAEAVEVYAKQDRNFRLLLDAAGHKSVRGDILLFLMVQMVVSSRQPDEDRAAMPTPWTDYVRFLPDVVLLPTMWTDEERRLLQGTSLEIAVRAKLLALEHEYDQFCEQSSDIPFWNDAFWYRKFPPQLRDWILADAWYRSRCLELPQFGPSMVPCIDMVNHSSTPNAYYEDRTAAPAGGGDAGVVLLLRPGQQVAASDEITISYTGSKGDDTLASRSSKPASEMLFSYGFIDPDSIRHSLILPVQPFPDDPLAKAKLHVFGEPAPRLEIERLQVDGVADSDDDDDDNTAGLETDKSPAHIRWTCPFAYLMCVNEEDGIDFRLRQETDGSPQLRMFWQGNDVTDSAANFEALASTHELAPLFRLRVVTVLQEIIESHLERMQAVGGDQYDDDEDDEDDESDEGDGQEANRKDDTDMADDSNSQHDCIRSSVAKQAAILRDIESRVLSSALETLEAERSGLLSNATVVAYLGSMEISQNNLVDEQAPNQGQADEAMHESEDDDFS
ncbi:hypothetical protein SCUCBS95973_006815 [Sporothrix curviconia]|uniref:SET domain-containing protein n=1 Tax=Sporothrix curviconia TaxID=1260050 RepID=A0ABP0CAH7_9PEZI